MVFVDLHFPLSFSVDSTHNKIFLLKIIMINLAHSAQQQLLKFKRHKLLRVRLLLCLMKIDEKYCLVTTGVIGLEI